MGSTASYGSNTAAWLVKFDVGGNILWSRTYDDANIYGIAGNNIIQTTDGGYAFSGTYSNQPGIADAMVVKPTALENHSGLNGLTAAVQMSRGGLYNREITCLLRLLNTASLPAITMASL